MHMVQLASRIHIPCPSYRTRSCTYQFVGDWYMSPFEGKLISAPKSSLWRSLHVLVTWRTQPPCLIESASVVNIKEKRQCEERMREHSTCKSQREWRFGRRMHIGSVNIFYVNLTITKNSNACFIIFERRSWNNARGRVTHIKPRIKNASYFKLRARALDAL